MADYLRERMRRRIRLAIAIGVLGTVLGFWFWLAIALLHFTVKYW